MSLYVQVPIQQIADGLTAIGWSSAGGGGDATLSYGSTVPATPVNGTLWYDTTATLLKLYTGGTWTTINVSAETIATISGYANTAQSAASTATQKLTEFKAIQVTATTLSAGASATASYNSGTGVITLGIPTGATGQGLSPKGTDTVANILLKVGTLGDYWIASDSGDGYMYDGSAWTNVGAVRGPQGLQGIQGIQGIKGDKGDAGDKGDTGATNVTNAVFTATASQTTFSTTYVVGNVWVYLNGVKLASTDFTATNGTSIVLATGATVGDVVEVVKFSELLNDAYATKITPTLTGLRETSVAMAANNIDLANGNHFTKTISGATTFTVSNVATTGTVNSFILELTNAGSATITWFGGVKWAGGTAPTLTTSGVDILGFYTKDGGTTYRGLVLAKDSK